MRKFLILALTAICLAACNNTAKNAGQTEEIKKDSIDYTNVKDKSFDELFTRIEATTIQDNVFKLISQDFTVITAGKDSAFNSMTASYGGWGQLFDKPTTWCILNASRYTLEFIQKEQTYTMSYFPEQYKEQVLAFGAKSGRDSDKMNETALTHIETPDGNISYKEARMIIECKLTEITTVTPKDFYSPDHVKFIEDGAKTGKKGYHKLVFGEITNVWIRK